MFFACILIILGAGIVKLLAAISKWAMFFGVFIISVFILGFLNVWLGVIDGDGVLKAFIVIFIVMLVLSAIWDFFWKSIGAVITAVISTIFSRF